MKKIALISKIGIGDVISIMPLLRKIKQVYPDSQVTIFSRDGGSLQGQTIFYVDNIVIYDKFWKILLLFQDGYDILIGWMAFSQLRSSFKRILYHTMFFLFPAKKKICFKSSDVALNKGRNLLCIKLEILRKIGVDIQENDYQPILPFTFSGQEDRIRSFLRENIAPENPKLCIIHAGGNRVTWPAEKWAELIKTLNKITSLKFIFIGGADDQEITKDIIRHLDLSVINSIGQFDIKETAALINQTDIFLSTNSGPMWIAAALKKRQIALCGPSKIEWEPTINENAVIIRKTIPRKHCSPPCDAPFCIYKDHLCMNSIEVSDVINALNSAGWLEG